MKWVPGLYNGIGNTHACGPRHKSGAKVTITVRFPPDLAKKLRRAARKAGASVNAYANAILMETVK